MGAFVVVFVNVLPDACPKFSWRGVFGDVYVVAFQASEPTLYDYVINPAGLSVHALSDAILFQKLDVIVAGELCALVRVDDCGHAIFINP